MNEFVADTHGLYWYLSNDPKLGSEASKRFQEAEGGEAVILIPSIVIAELYYLLQKQSALETFEALYDQLAASAYVRLEPFQAEDVLLFPELSEIPEMHDRIIAAVAFAHDAPCLTRDGAMVGSGLIQTIW